ncbi:histidine kinase [Lentzea sp. BCCO 10_0856]|uniref:Histidine kinase n=1 Tax=Lentzea miocenica TaxID=3095431 RepID=A0ABU4SWL9_9PSEU|nr:histidine kinase [Lentzea sp. BCCO 10_0856]MDX8030291.1 histidine kinase [Lentzea sp. BCCO 10_0856]
MVPLGSQEVTLLGWWQSRGNAKRFDFYVRATFYLSYLVLPPLLIISLTAEISTAALIALVAAVLIHTALSAPLVHFGIEHHLGKAPFPRRLLAALLIFTCVVLVAGQLAYPHPTPGKNDSPANGIAVIFLVLTVTSLSAVLRPRVLVLVAAAGGAFLFLTSPPDQAFFGALMLQLVVFAFRTTLWMLGLVWELDRSREIRASLAVAEERLRFARDLHDVVGRNLSVVALKADLAAQLARRGRLSAIDEMLEVRRIAHDSLDELRAVVSGYRTADLSVELAGARSLLDSAGIDCRVIGEVSTADHADTLGWAVREGVTNVLRHSEATTCTITLRGNVLTMTNDGVTSSGFRFGSGLTGLRERVSALGGSVTATPEPPNRFVLTVELP